jgi:hypothetical protein
MIKKSSYFSSPKPDTELWKYLDFTKFVSLLETNSLYFARADKMLDPYEGTYPLADYQQARKQVFLNCWHQNDFESAAMWELYAQRGEGMAIKSTYAKLEKSLLSYDKQDLHLGEINYIDFATIKESCSDPLEAFAYKRKSFEHEKEVRAVIKCIDQSHCRHKGIFVPINMNELVDEVYIAPYSEDWIRDLAEAMVSKYKLNIPVLKSKLYDDPNSLNI